MFLESFEDATLIVLIVAAVVSFVVGLIEDPAKGYKLYIIYLYYIYITMIWLNIL